MMSNDGLRTFVSFFHGEKREANYRKPSDPMEKHNPFTEALPETLKREELLIKLTMHPTRELSVDADRDERMRAVLRIKGFIEPTSTHLRIYDRFDGLLRSSYFGRNPIKPEFQKQLHMMYPDIDMDELRKMESLPFEMASGFTLSGLSGTGKTVGIKSILLRYPQILLHRRYEKHKFFCQQLVWLYLGCPPKGTIRDLISEAFWIISSLTGDEELSKLAFKRNLSDTQLAMLLIKRLEMMGAGIIVIDEIQNLLPHKDRLKLSKSSASGIVFSPVLIKFLLHVSNTLKVPMVISGTPEALLLLGAQMAIARRASGETALYIKRFENDAAWRTFLESLWLYHFVLHKVELTDELVKTLYDRSQGIIHCAVRLFAFAQWEAMYRGTEKITTEIILSVYNSCMGPLKPWLKYIENGRELELASPAGGLPELALEEFVDSKSVKVSSTSESKGQATKTKPQSRRAKKAEKTRVAQDQYQRLQKEGLIPKT